MTVKRVLIVDDQRDIRQLLRFGLEVLGPDVNITDVPSGEEAMLVISRQTFDVLVSDVRLAGMSGLELIHKVRKRNPGLRVILITGMTDSEVRQQVKEAGAEYFFFKPVDMEEFQAAVRTCLALEENLELKLPAPEGELEKAPTDPIELLSQISRRLGGAEVFLVEASGQKISLSGGIPGILSKDQSWAAIKAAGAALLELLGVLPGQNPGFEEARGYAFIEGKEASVHLAPMNARLYLLAVISPDVNLQSRELMESLLKAASELSTVDLQAILVEPTAMQAEPEEEPGFESDLMQLDSVFQRSSGQQMDGQDLDHFWDELAEQAEAGGSPDSGAISYDQARRLGLAPAEGEA